MNQMYETATLSSKGQVVIPAKLRKQARLEKGDRIILKYREAEDRIEIYKPESIDEIADRLTSLIKPDKLPLEDASELYATRGSRV